MKEKEFEIHAADALRDLLGQVSVVRLKDIKLEPSEADPGVDIVAQIKVSGKRHTLVCEVRNNGQPRYVRTALLELRNYVSDQVQNALERRPAHHQNQFRNSKWKNGAHRSS